MQFQEFAEKVLNLSEIPGKHASGAESPPLFLGIYGTTEVVP